MAIRVGLTTCVCVSSFAAYLLGVQPVWTFLLGVPAIAAFAEWIRLSTDQLALHVGPMGGLLTVSFGSIAELVLAVFVLARGQIEVVHAQITGSIIGTSLLGAPLAPWVGWTEHFFIGTVLWGMAFAAFEQITPPIRADTNASTAVKAIVFSIGVWMLMMVLLMPPAGARWFGVWLGYGAPLGTLVLYVIYGISPGVIYGILTPDG